MAITPLILSGSINGRPIAITGESTAAANTIHTSDASAATFDFIFLFAYNVFTSSVDLFIELGQATGPIKVTIPAGGAELVLAVPSLPLSAGNLLKAYVGAGDANRIFVAGSVARRT